MKDQGSPSESGIMRAAARALSKVSSWSASKQEFASRVTNNGSFATERLSDRSDRSDGDAVRKA
jgi:hypothetical protein